MKYTSSLLFAVVTVFSLAECFPRTPRDEPELVFVPLEANRPAVEELEREAHLPEGFLREEETPFILPFGFSFPMPNFFRGIDALFKRVTDGLKGFSANPSNWGNVTNATSTQKEVDGFIVTVNETTYSKGDDDSKAVWHVKVIDVKPTPGAAAEEGAKGSVEPDTKRESTATSAENSEEKREQADNSNEIPKNADAESFDSKHSETAELLETREYHPSETFNEVDNSIDVIETKPISLDRDIYVNTLQDKLKGDMFMVPSDVEVFDVVDGKASYSYLPYPPNTFRERTQKIVT